MNATINIANDFSRYPAGRYRADGKFSGAAFRDDLLVPALRKPGIGLVCVCFDDVAGFGSSFLEEAFGGLIRNNIFEKEFLDAHLRLVATDPELEDFVGLAMKHMEEAAKRAASAR